MFDPHWLDSQIGRFEWHVKTHILGPARVLARAFQENSPPLNDSGYFILCGVTPYFEGLGQHLLGADPRDDRGFKAGFYDVYSHTMGVNTECIADRVKNHVRHGLFHDAVVRGRTELSRNWDVAINLTPERLEINPFYLVRDIESHLDCYTAHLRDSLPTYDCIRERFAARRRQIEAAFQNLAPVTNTMTTTTPSPNDPAFRFGPYNAEGGLDRC